MSFIIFGKSQLKAIENALKTVTFRRSAHNTDINRTRRNEIPHANGSKVGAIFGTEGFDRIRLANHSPPHWPSRGQIIHRRPVGKFSCENHAGVTEVVEEFRSAFYPVLGIDSNHQASLVEERWVLAVDAGLKNKIPINWQIKEMPVCR